MAEYSQHAIHEFIKDHLSGEYRVSNECVDPFRTALETYVQDVASRGWDRADAANRKTIQSPDVDVEQVPPKESIELPLAPLRRLVNEAVPETAKVSENTVIALASIMEEYGETVIYCAEMFMHHADRRTLWVNDIELYFNLFEDLPE